MVITIFGFQRISLNVSAYLVCAFQNGGYLVVRGDVFLFMLFMFIAVD